MAENKLPKKISLRARCNTKNILERIEDITDVQYVLNAQYPWISVHYKPNNQGIIGVDPVDGPMVCLGDTHILEGYKITNIRNSSRGIVLTFSPDDSISNE